MKTPPGRALLALWLAVLLLFPAPSFSSPLVIPDTGFGEEQKIVHLLNRIGYGPRPGDVERVKRLGIPAYIEQQLHPEALVDEGLEQRLANLKTVTMNPTELLTAYPPPQLLRQIERRLSAQTGMDPEAEGSLFPELQRRRERQARRAQAQPDSNQPEAEMESDDPVRQRRTRQERLEQAMNGPQRIVIELSQAKLLRAIYSERQLQEVMTDFWFNHFNVFVGKGADRWLTSSYEREAIRPHALGKFRDLLGATAQHPAMLFYLDNWLSSDPKANIDERELRRRYAVQLQQQGLRPGGLMLDILRRRGMDTAQAERAIERQLGRMDGEEPGAARPRRGGFRRMEQLGQQNQRPPQPQRRRSGLNENYARELLELHTLGVDGGYTQQDVIEVARCFTGWTMLPLQLGQEFIYVDELHDQGTKTVLGQGLENRGRQDGLRVLDLLARQPATARFISTKLARRFVSDSPPPSLIDRMAKTFLDTDGDIRAVLGTMLTSEEFWSPAAVAAKVKTPLEFVVSAARASGAEVSDSPPGLVFVQRQLGQPLYAAQPPTGYKDTADAWVSTGALLGRMKVALSLAANRVPGVSVEPSPEWLRAQSSEDLVSRLGRDIVGRPLSEQTQTTLVSELANARKEAGTADAQAQARLALGWLLASPEFQRK
ncbi:MAG: DUF1800 domain-containing protein [Candidatus Acidiferrales bacterium]